jgi:hypothetical protein
MHHAHPNLYTTKAAALCSYSLIRHFKQGTLMAAHQSRGPWLPNVLCCHTGSSLTMASSESVYSFQCLIFFVHRIFTLRPLMGWYRQIPQFAPHIFNSVPSSVSRRSCRVLMVVSSPTVITFAIFATARQPHTTHAGSHVARVTRLQCSLNVTARSLASPSPTRTFTIELSPDGSPQSDVDYNYTANNQLPQPDFHRQDMRPYGLQTKSTKVNWY